MEIFFDSVKKKKQVDRFLQS